MRPIGLWIILAVSLALTPLAAEAQQGGTIRQIGYISSAPSTPLTDSWWQAFVAGLREHGWVEGENIVIERRYADLRKEAAFAVAQELVRARVDVIVVSSTLTALATHQGTRPRTGSYISLPFQARRKVSCSTSRASSGSPTMRSARV
jgi:ABC-type uncharacterized transport system substrate-binding protein